jgi:hypothetical protein
MNQAMDPMAFRSLSGAQSPIAPATEGTSAADWAKMLIPAVITGAAAAMTTPTPSSDMQAAGRGLLGFMAGLQSRLPREPSAKDRWYLARAEEIERKRAQIDAELADERRLLAQLDDEDRLAYRADKAEFAKQYRLRRLRPDFEQSLRQMGIADEIISGIPTDLLPGLSADLVKEKWKAEHRPGPPPQYQQTTVLDESGQPRRRIVELTSGKTWDIGAAPGGAERAPTTNELAIRAINGDREAAAALAAAGGMSRFLADLSTRAAGMQGVVSPEIAALTPEEAMDKLVLLNRIDILKPLVGRALLDATRAEADVSRETRQAPGAADVPPGFRPR